MLAGGRKIEEKFSEGRGFQLKILKQWKSAKTQMILYLERKKKKKHLYIFQLFLGEHVKLYYNSRDNQKLYEIYRQWEHIVLNKSDELKILTKKRKQKHLPRYKKLCKS